MSPRIVQKHCVRAPFAAKKLLYDLGVAGDR